MFCKSSTLAETRNVMNEIWKDVKGYEGLYQVSNLGRVRNGRTGRIRKLTFDEDGYLQVTLYGKKINVTRKVHRLVAEAFIPNPDNLPCINHKDEDKTNNRVENLEWCTVKYNNTYGDRIEKYRKSNTNGKKSKPILQYTHDGKFVREWPSMCEIERKKRWSHGNIGTAIRKNKIAYGFIWKYKQPEAV